MKTNSIISIAAAFAMLFFSCSNDSEVKDTATQSATEQKSRVDAINVTGNYVNPDYALRDKGYDWVAVMITAKDEHNIDIKVRSRPDHKRPTCTLDAVAGKLKPGLYRAELQYGNILFMFSDSSLTIAPEDQDDETAVYYYCAGGGTLKGNYNKINEPVDTGLASVSSAIH